MNASPTPARRMAVGITGGAIAALASLTLLVAAAWVPWAHFGTIATGPTDVTALIRSFTRSWLLSLATLGLIYSAGLSLIARSRLRTQELVTRAGDTPTRSVVATVLALLLLAAAGAASSLSVALVFVAPPAGTAVAAAWSALLVSFVALALWGRFWRSLGIAIGVAGALLGVAVVVVAWAVTSEERSMLIEKPLRAFDLHATAPSALTFASVALSTWPLIAAALIVIGLPFAIIIRGRGRRAPWLAILVALVFLVSSPLVPSLVELVTLFATRPNLPLVTQSLDLMVLPPPPPPPPPTEPPPPVAEPPASVDSPPDVPRATGKTASSEKPVRIHGGIKEPQKVKTAAPVYPALAQAAGIEGVVILELTIGVDGKVAKAQVLKSQPLLDQAAIDAVMQWEYAPTIVGGRAVPVIMTVSVPFRK